MTSIALTTNAARGPRAARGRGRGHIRLTMRVLGALLLLFVGADHLYEYKVDDYSAVPTIGTLFLLNFIGATTLGLLLLAPLEKLLGRAGRAIAEFAAAGGLAIAAGSLVALLVSEQTPLFGFMESNYRPAIIVAIASESAAAVSLAVFAVLNAAGRVRAWSTTSTGRDTPSASRRS
jgi:hypothetical protein